MSTRRLTLLALAAVLAVASAQAQSQPAAKATARVGRITAIVEPNAGFTTILSQGVKTPNGKDLFVDVSLECGLSTKTVTRSRRGNRDTAVAEAGVYVQVVVDGRVALPGEVVFCRRTQELSASLDGLLSRCLIEDPACSADSISGDCGLVLDPVCIEEDLLPEEVSLFLDTMNANSFHFVFPDLTSGTHEVEVQARIAASTCTYAGDEIPIRCPDDGLGSAEALATLGLGSVTIETVRMIREEDVEIEIE